MTSNNNKSTATITTPSWKLEGDYFEGCNCDLICPCIFKGDPDESYCLDSKFPYGKHILPTTQGQTIGTGRFNLLLWIVLSFTHIDIASIIGYLV